MLSVSVQEDINDYKPKIIAGLTMRSLVCSGSAILIALVVGCYCWFILGLPYDITTYIVIVLSMPMWAAGFIKPHGLDLEKFIPLWIRHNFKNNKLIYKPSFLINNQRANSNVKAIRNARKEKTGMAVSNTYQMMCKRPDFEAYRPTDGNVSL